MRNCSAPCFPRQKVRSRGSSHTPWSPQHSCTSPPHKPSTRCLLYWCSPRHTCSSPHHMRTIPRQRSRREPRRGGCRPFLPGKKEVQQGERVRQAPRSIGRKVRPHLCTRRTGARVSKGEDTRGPHEVDGGSGWASTVGIVAPVVPITHPQLTIVVAAPALEGRVVLRREASEDR
jgi:hypothetical protein